jgi:hypothetical protein
VWAGAPDNVKELAKKRGSEFPKKKFNGEKRDGAKQRNVKPDDVGSASTISAATGTASTAMPANSNMRVPKEVVGVVREKLP